MRTWNQTISLLRNDEHKIVANGYPDLRVDCILGGSAEGLELLLQFNATAVKYKNHPFKTSQKVFILVKLRGFLHQDYRKVLIDTPILLLVGLRQSGSGHHLDARPVEVSAEVKCSLNISQTSSVSELSKAHHHELVTAIELDGVPVTLVAVDTLLELVFVKERHDLSEDCFSFVHGLRMAS